MSGVSAVATEPPVTSCGVTKMIAALGAILAHRLEELAQHRYRRDRELCNAWPLPEIRPPITSVSHVIGMPSCALGAEPGNHAPVINGGRAIDGADLGAQFEGDPPANTTGASCSHAEVDELDTLAEQAIHGAVAGGGAANAVRPA